VSLLQSGDTELAAKSASARQLGSSRVVGRREIVYTTETATDEQANAREAAEFDARLGRGGGGGSSGRQQQQQQLPEGRANRIDDVFSGRRRGGGREREREAAQVEVDWDSGSGSRQQQEQAARQQQRRRQEEWDRLNRW
jgi:hypothetical protein